MISKQNLVLAISASLVVGIAIGLIGGVLFSRVFVFAHHGPMRPEAMERMHPRHERGMQFLERRLDLSDEQMDAIETIVERSRGTSDSLHDLARAQIHELLTPEQRERWERMNRRMFPRGRPGMPPRRPGGPPHPMDEPGPPPDDVP